MKIIKVKFEGNPKFYSYTYNSDNIKKSDTVIVEGDSCIDYGTVVSISEQNTNAKGNESASNQKDNTSENEKVSNQEYDSTNAEIIDEASNDLRDENENLAENISENINENIIENVNENISKNYGENHDGNFGENVNENIDEKSDDNSDDVNQNDLANQNSDSNNNQKAEDNKNEKKPKGKKNKGKENVLKNILRVANKNDLEKIKTIKKKENGVYSIFVNQVRKNGLKFKPIKAKLSFDEKKVYYYYYSEERVDFRELLKELIPVVKKKIELRQVDSRENVSIFGGLSVCGKECCCASFLKNKPKVNIKMAINQNLPPNSDKISGLCGKPMCCIAFENDTYTKQKKGMPKKGQTVKMNDSEYKVIDSNTLLEKISLREFTGVVDENKNKLLSDDVTIISKEEFLNRNNSEDKNKVNTDVVDSSFENSDNSDDNSINNKINSHFEDKKFKKK